MRSCSSKRINGIVLVLLAMAAIASGADPFGVQAAWEMISGKPVIRVEFIIPPGHFLYADHLHVTAGDVALAPVDTRAPARVLDKFTNEEKAVYESNIVLTFAVPDNVRGLELQVAYQGCNDKVCFFPQKKTFMLEDRVAVADDLSSRALGEHGADWKALAGLFMVAASDSGYLAKDSFMAFLDRAEMGIANEAALDDSLRRGWLLTALLILAGGVGLNLTPCVLPLIPINLAIIGAGARAGSRSRGFLLGGAYGVGMAAVYGVLGLLVVLTGSKFGTLNASPWFNAVIAVIFVALALAMFDVFTIDFARFQTRMGKPGGGRGHVMASLSMGALAALLAGACVAPVVISVLLLAGSLYASGQALGLLLPFLLGVGMGLPWPFAGAGLSFLPKPGKWMTVVKYVFGVMILGLALYYGGLAWHLFRDRATVAGGAGTAERSNRELVAGLQKALDEGKPVFLDFWATWCKNCHAMEKTTFLDPEVQARLGAFVLVKYQAESPNESPAREVLDHFGAVGLPTYVVLVPSPSP